MLPFLDMLDWNLSLCTTRHSCLLRRLMPARFAPRANFFYPGSSTMPQAWRGLLSPIDIGYEQDVIRGRKAGGAQT